MNIFDENINIHHPNCCATSHSAPAFTRRERGLCICANSGLSSYLQVASSPRSKILGLLRSCAVLAFGTQ